MSDEAMQSYLNQHGKDCTFHCTISCNEFFYLPPAWVLVERAQADVSTGIRLPVLRQATSQSARRLPSIWR